VLLLLLLCVRMWLWLLLRLLPQSRLHVMWPPSLHAAVPNRPKISPCTTLCCDPPLLNPHQPVPGRCAAARRSQAGARRRCCSAFRASIAPAGRRWLHQRSYCGHVPAVLEARELLPGPGAAKVGGGLLAEEQQGGAVKRLGAILLVYKPEVGKKYQSRKRVVMGETGADEPSVAMQTSLSDEAVRRARV
jgi:hypothetical protein